MVSDERKDMVQWEGRISVILNSLLFLGKAWAGLVVGSMALVADGFHSLSDSLSSVILIIGATISSKAPDKEHPYGHGRAEYVAAVLIALFLWATSFELAKASLERVYSPSPPSFNLWIFLFVIATIAAKLGLTLIGKKIASTTSSNMVAADALHHLTDAVSSFLVLVSLLLSPFGYPWMDGFVGAVVAVFIFHAGYTIVKNSVDDLLGRPVEDSFLEAIRDVAMSHPEVTGVHDVMVHDYGALRIASVHVEHDASCGVMRSHDICHEVEEMLEENLKVFSVIHADPIDYSDPEVNKIRQNLFKLAEGDPFFEEIHDIRLVGGLHKKKIVCDLSLSPNVPSERRVKEKERLVSLIREMYPGYEVSVYLEPRYQRTPRVPPEGSNYGQR